MRSNLKEWTEYIHRKWSVDMIRVFGEGTKLYRLIQVSIDLFYDNPVTMAISEKFHYLKITVMYCFHHYCQTMQVI